jgi:coenzyme F420-dependent glucose-6-phosphate dehydrogenase
MTKSERRPAEHAMPSIGYHASHEQFAPDALLAELVAAQQAGFRSASCSDHFMPWAEVQGQSGYAWAWLGAALQATDLPVGVVTAPGYRQHPALVAQAAATLAQMFPGRFWLALGSGERLNEHITGVPWPAKDERNARLRECAEVMRALWRGEMVNHEGRVRVEDARLYTLPPVAPLLFGAAMTPETARLIAPWADGLITVSQPLEKLRPIVAAFREEGGAGKPMRLQVKVSYDADEERAKAGAHEQWRMLMFDSDVLAELKLPAQFEAASRHVRREDVERQVHCSADPQRHIDWLAGYVELGFGELLVHNVNRGQRAFIEMYGERVLPAFAAA